MLGRPKYEVFLYAALKKYQPPDMDDCSFERAVNHLMEYNFDQKVDLSRKEVVYRSSFDTLYAMGFMYGRNKELEEVDKLFNAYLLEQASNLISFIVGSMQQFREQTDTESVLMSLPEVYFRCYRVGTRLFGTAVEANKTDSTMRLYSEPKYGLFREFAIGD